jgi:hypothetical protein
MTHVLGSTGLNLTRTIDTHTIVRQEYTMKIATNGSPNALSSVLFAKCSRLLPLIYADVQKSKVVEKS